MDKAKFLYKFLKKHRCLKEYVENTVDFRKNMYSINDSELDTRDVLKFLRKYGHLSSAFCWDSTKQGQKFWEKLDREYWRCVHKFC